MSEKKFNWNLRIIFFFLVVKILNFKSERLFKDKFVLNFLHWHKRTILFWKRTTIILEQVKKVMMFKWSCTYRYFFFEKNGRSKSWILWTFFRKKIYEKDENKIKKLELGVKGEKPICIRNRVEKILVRKLKLPWVFFFFFCAYSLYNIIH